METIVSYEKEKNVLDRLGFVFLTCREAGRQTVAGAGSGACDSGCPLPPPPPTRWSSRDGYCGEAAVS